MNFYQRPFPRPVLSFITILGILTITTVMNPAPAQESVILNPCGTTGSCLTIDEVVKKVKWASYDSRKAMEKLYQARQNIRVRLGNIFPHFHMGNAIDFYGLDYFALGTSFLGFLFPSHWFEWKESILFYHAEKYSFVTLLANQVALAEEIYLNINREKINYQIHLNFIKILDEFIAYAKLAKSAPIPKDRENILHQLELLDASRSDMLTDIILLEETLKELHIDLAMAMAMEDNWENYSIQGLNLPDLQGVEYLEYQNLIDHSIKISPELKSLRYLEKAAKYARKARMFSFLHPDAGPESSLGFGYRASLKIAKSFINEIRIEGSETKERLKLNLKKAFDNANTAIKIYAESLEGAKSSRIFLNNILDDLIKKQELDKGDLLDALELNMKFELNKNFAQHLYLVSQSHINRLILNGPYYQELEGRVPLYTRPHAHSLRYISDENKEIEKDIRLGKLQLE